MGGRSRLPRNMLVVGGGVGHRSPQDEGQGSHDTPQNGHQRDVDEMVPNKCCLCVSPAPPGGNTSTTYILLEGAPPPAFYLYRYNIYIYIHNMGGHSPRNR